MSAQRTLTDNQHFLVPEWLWFLVLVGVQLGSSEILQTENRRQIRIDVMSSTNHDPVKSLRDAPIRLQEIYCNVLNPVEWFVL